MPCSPLKIPGSCADKNLVFTDYSLAAPPAHAAVRIHHNGSAFHKGVDQPFMKCLKIHLLAGWNHYTDQAGLMNSQKSACFCLLGLKVCPTKPGSYGWL